MRGSRLCYHPMILPGIQEQLKKYLVLTTITITPLNGGSKSYTRNRPTSCQGLITRMSMGGLPGVNLYNFATKINAYAGKLKNTLMPLTPYRACTRKKLNNTRAA